MTFKRGIDKSLRPSLEREKPPSLPIVQQPAAGTVEYRKAEGILVLASPGFPENAAQDFPCLLYTSFWMRISTGSGVRLPTPGVWPSMNSVWTIRAASA